MGGVKTGVMGVTLTPLDRRFGEDRPSAEHGERQDLSWRFMLSEACSNQQYPLIGRGWISEDG
jgi:hypothetical protein